MERIKLTTVQKEILKAVVDLHHEKRRPVQGEEIAEKLNRHSGTIRNQMVALRALGLVEGISGPKGGYYPKPLAFEALEMPYIEKEVHVPVYINGKPADSLTVTDISFTSVQDPDNCRALIHVKGTLKGVEIGDTIALGPTPVQELVLKGRVLGRDDIDSVIMIDIEELLGIPKIKVGEITTKIKVKVSPETEVREAAKKISKSNVRGAVVLDRGRLVGIVSAVDITRAVAEGKEKSRVEEIMSGDVKTINENTTLRKAIEIMEKENISRAVVLTETGRIKGIITRTDILARLAALSKYYFSEKEEQKLAAMH